MAAIVVVVLLALIAFRLFPGKDVLVVNDGRTMHVRATFDARTEALDAADVALLPSDRVLVAEAGDRASVAVQRARLVTVNIDGESVRFHTQAVTVAGALAAAGAELRQGDQVLVNGTLVTERAPLDAVTSITTALQARATSLRQAGAPITTEPTISVIRATPVAIVLDTTEITHYTTATTVDEVLKQVGILVREGDLVEPKFDAAISPGLRIRIAKARNVTVVLDGKQHTMITQAATVGAALRVLEIDPGPEDTVTPDPATLLTSGMTVTIGLKRIVQEESRDPVPPGASYLTDPALPQGETRIEQGTDGLRVSKYTVTYKNGVEVARELNGSEIVQAPTPTRYITGTKPASNGAGAPSAPSIQARDFTGAYRQKISAVTTWYNASHGGKTRDDPWYGYTATGVRLDKGICATDPSVIPMGTWMYIPGYGTCLAADVGGGVKGNHIDLGFPESAGANPWGTQTIDVYILD